MSLSADIHDYRRAFYKHFETIKGWNVKCNTRSRSLLLIYCVECGLKYRLMKKFKLFRVEDFSGDKKIFHEHDFQKLLVQLNICEYRFPEFTTKHNETVTPKTYHEFQRYGIEISNVDEDIVHQYNANLSDIVEWIRNQEE